MLSFIIYCDLLYTWLTQSHNLYHIAKNESDLFQFAFYEVILIL